MYLIIKETTFKSHAPIFQVVNQTTELSLADTLAKCLNAEAKEQNETYSFKVCSFGSVAYEAYCPEDDELVRWTNKEHDLDNYLPQS